MVKAKNIKKHYGKKNILNGVSIEAAPGEIVALVGRNGCGKTTFLEILAGIKKADSGEISFWNNNPLKNSEYFKKFIGYVPQENPLFEDLSVVDNLIFWSNKKEVSSSIINEFELNDILKQKVSQLSGGMKRRLAIACIVQRQMPVIILDEPTSSLDLVYQDSIRKWMKDFTSRNGIVILSTHNEKEIEFADKVYIYDEGVTKLIEWSEKSIKLL